MPRQHGWIGPQKLVGGGLSIEYDSGILSASKYSLILGNSKLEMELWFLEHSSLGRPLEFEYY